MKNNLLILMLVTLLSCRNSKWEETPTNGISEEPESLDPIYFQDAKNGIIGGYMLIQNKDSKNTDKLDFVPVAYLTNDGGKNWTPIHFDKNIKKPVNDVSLSGRTITCLVDSMLIKSTDLGLHWNVAEKSNFNDLREKYFANAYHDVGDRDFQFDGKKYGVKESYQFKTTEVIVCYGEKTMTDYYFISKDNGKNWRFLQEDSGSNKRKFLLDGEYLITYQFPYGLQKLKLR